MFTPRISWDDLPADVRARIEAELGAAVVAAHGATGGFSPGVAARLDLADGRRVFLKAVSGALNVHSLELYARERHILAELPPGLPSPRLIGGWDDAAWAVLVLEHVEGAAPRTPWRAEDLRLALAAYDRVAEAGTPAPADLKPASEVLALEVDCWNRVSTHERAWVRERLPDLRAASARTAARIDGDTLAHLDVRADNLIEDPAGRIWVIDWPFATRAAPWVDVACLLHEVIRCPADAAAVELVRAHLRDHFGLPDDAIIDWLVMIAGYYVFIAEQPPPPNLPTIRDFQRACAEGLLDWLEPRLGVGNAEGQRWPGSGAGSPE